MAYYLPESNTSFRNAIKNRALHDDLDKLWHRVRVLQGLQKGTTDQGQDHCLRVEGNIWKLVCNYQTKFKDEDFFILSASAALHDIAKISADNKKDHGEEAKDKILKTDSISQLFDDKGLREAVAKIVGVHNNGDIDSLPEEEFVVGDAAGIFLRSLASIFRLADMVDSDYRRCDYLLMSFKRLMFPHEMVTWIGRSSIRGPKTILPNSKTIVLQASPNDEKEEMMTLAYLDSLNNSFTLSQKNALENCRVQFSENGVYKQDTLHFPVHFSLEIDGKDREGLVHLHKTCLSIHC